VKGRAAEPDNKQKMENSIHTAIMQLNSISIDERDPMPKDNFQAPAYYLERIGSVRDASPD
jgi:hypothetical protein